MSSGIRAVPCGQADRHDEAVTFCNYANSPKNQSLLPDVLQAHKDY